MKNEVFCSYNVIELTERELTETNGGGLIYDLFHAVGRAVGHAAAAIEDAAIDAWDSFTNPQYDNSSDSMGLH